MTRHFYKEFEQPEDKGKQDATEKVPSQGDSDKYQIVTRARARASTLPEGAFVSVAVPTPKGFYRESRLEEIKALQNVGCFEVVPRGDAEGHRLYHPKFVDKVKPSWEKRSRLCDGLFTAAPTIKRLSIRLLLCLATSFGFQLSTRDVTKAFSMPKTPLRRPVYLRPPPEMGLPKGFVLKVVKPLYGMPESPIHWFKTYTDFFTHNMLYV